MILAHLFSGVDPAYTPQLFFSLYIGVAETPLCNTKGRATLDIAGVFQHMIPIPPMREVVEVVNCPLWHRRSSDGQFADRGHRRATGA